MRNKIYSGTAHYSYNWQFIYVKRQSIYLFDKTIFFFELNYEGMPFGGWLLELIMGTDLYAHTQSSRKDKIQLSLRCD